MLYRFEEGERQNRVVRISFTNGQYRTQTRRKKEKKKRRERKKSRSEGPMPNPREVPEYLTPLNRQISAVLVGMERILLSRPSMPQNNGEPMGKDVES